MEAMGGPTGHYYGSEKSNCVLTFIAWIAALGNARQQTFNCKPGPRRATLGAVQISAPA